MDGTTLDTNHQITQITLKALERAHHKSIYIVFTTGRSFLEVVPLLQGLHFLKHLPISYNNGSLIRMGSKRLQQIPLVPEDVKALLPLARELKLHIRCQADEDIYIEKQDDFFTSYSSRHGMNPILVGQIDYVLDQRALKVTFVGSAESLKTLLINFRVARGQSRLVVSGERVADMTHIKASKLTSAQWICRYFGIDHQIRIKSWRLGTK